MICIEHKEGEERNSCL